MKVSVSIPVSQAGKLRLKGGQPRQLPSGIDWSSGWLSPDPCGHGEQASPGRASGLKLPPNHQDSHVHFLVRTWPATNDLGKGVQAVSACTLCSGQTYWKRWYSECAAHSLGTPMRVWGEGPCPVDTHLQVQVPGMWMKRGCCGTQ